MYELLQDLWYWLTEGLKFINEYKEGILILISFLGIIVPINKVSKEKKLELSIQNLRLFHRMIKSLDNLDPKKPVGLTEQEAIVFELRNFPKYKEFSKVMLSKRIKAWEADEKYADLVNIANETLKKLT